MTTPDSTDRKRPVGRRWNRGWVIAALGPWPLVLLAVRFTHAYATATDPVGQAMAPLAIPFLAVYGSVAWAVTATCALAVLRRIPEIASANTRQVALAWLPQVLWPFVPRALSVLGLVM